MAEKKPLTPVVRNRLLRLVLRAFPLPFIPVPELYDLFLDLRRSEGDVDQQVTEAIDSLRKTTNLVDRLEGGLKERSEKLARLREDYNKLSSLANIERENAEAFVKQLEETVGKGKSKDRWLSLGFSLLSGLVFFILGIIFANAF
ncbi:MAG: hypothetical protein OEV49_11785 [candidate division Zixibacteria bacterium]|nr:hypothetical protein [candidate division Zixibacteria bacterium]MDH3936010.1 hypothetical protein [candidate division Zixibacteria bacterium]